MSYAAATRAQAAPGGDARPARLAFFLENLEGGGVQKTTLLIAAELARRGHHVDALVCGMHGPLREELPEGVRIVPLEPAFAPLARAWALRADPLGIGTLLGPVLLPSVPSSTLRYLPALVRFLRDSTPTALFAATPYMNAEAVLAKRLAGVEFRLLLTEHNDLSRGHPFGSGIRGRQLSRLCRRTYPEADAIVTVSRGLAEDLSRRTGIPRDRITTVYNPVVTRELADKASQPLDHPWFAADSPPVILGVGRLGRAKDFATLIRAFARVQHKRSARLVILGKGKKGKGNGPDKRQTELMELARELGVEREVDFPGFVRNPFPYMAHAAVFAVSSLYDGFCNVLVEAMACGCPVVSTDCPSGPAEILENGKYGPLVPVGDDAALAEAIWGLLDNPTDPELLRTRAASFTSEKAVARYEEILLGAEVT